MVFSFLEGYDKCGVFTSEHRRIGFAGLLVLPPARGRRHSRTGVC